MVFLKEMNKEKFIKQKSVSEKIPIDDLQEDLFKYFIKYHKESLTRDELRDFCKLMLLYCKLTRHPNSSKETPDVYFYDNEEVYGSYNSGNIRIKESYFDDVLNKRECLSGMVKLIGHEMMHYEQDSFAIDYYYLTMEGKQYLVDEKSKTLVDEYKNHFYITKENVEFIHDLFPWLEQVPAGYINMLDYYKDVGFASYYTQPIERDARDESIKFASGFLSKLLKNKQSLSSDAAEMEVVYLEQKNKEYCDNYVKYKALIDQFSSVYNISEEQLLNLINDVESKNGRLNNLYGFNYEKALMFFLKNKTKEEKEKLLKIAIFNGYEKLTEVLLNSMKMDVDFIENKKHLANVIDSCLSGEAYGDSKFQINKYFRSDIERFLAKNKMTSDDLDMEDTELQRDVSHPIEIKLKEQKGIKFSLFSEEKLNNLLMSYAKFCECYYSYDNQHKILPEDVENLKVFNKKIEESLKRKLKNKKDINSGKDLSLFAEERFSESLIDDVLANNDNVLELFAIMYSGVYKKDGKFIELTKKQRQVLAEFLVKVSEKKVGGYYSQKNNKKQTYQEKDVDLRLGLN